MNNDVFVQACILSEEDWINSIPYPDKEHQFSKQFEKKMNVLIDKMRNDRYHILTRRATKLIIIAALIAALTTTVFAAPSARDYIIKHFSTYSSYIVNDSYDGEIDDGLILDYIPDGFELVYKYEADDVIDFEYENGDKNFHIIKSTYFYFIDFDTEKFKYEESEYEGISYIYLKTTKGSNCFIWNNGEYQYSLGGNLEKEELYEIAKCTK